jgi:hypothetical protein
MEKLDGPSDRVGTLRGVPVQSTRRRCSQGAATVLNCAAQADIVRAAGEAPLHVIGLDERLI